MNEGLLHYSTINSKGIAIAVSYTLKDIRSIKAGRPDLEDIRHLCDRDGLICDKIITAEQVHSDNIVIVDGASKDEVKGADALITDKSQTPLAIFTADCIAGLILDEKRPSIGIFHAGWKGTLLDTAGKTIKTMKDTYDTDPQSIFVALSPSIKVCCYAVREERARMFFERGYKEYVIRILGEPHIDLQGIIRKQIIEEGVPKENIYIHPHCTYEMRDAYPSYRRDGELASRIVNIIMLK
ncbi:MAG: peptidoglycan editing factor PgeF [bacterium]